MTAQYPAPAMKVVALAQDGVEALGLGSICEVWGEEYHPEDDAPIFDFSVAAPHPGRLRGAAGFDVHVEHGLDQVDDADLVCVLPKRDFTVGDPAVTEALRAAEAREALILAHCTAVFELGHAGMLDGRRVTTHWRHAAHLTQMFPEAKVDADVLYVRDGNVVTGAGSAASFDASLYLMRELYGAQAATTTARRMVVPPHRDGGQAQFIAQPVPECEAETLGPLLSWIVEHLDSPLDVDTLARQALMSPRTFARRFRAETGATPHAWITRQRVLRAEQLLEQSDRSIDWISTEVGFANAAALRHHFTRLRGISPLQYRRRFAA